MMQVAKNSQSSRDVRIEPDNSSAIISHESFSVQVDSICHHSGRYLTRHETNPSKPPLLHEQHDFPGMPALDDLFGRAAHASTFQHFMWSHALIKGLGHFCSGVSLLVMFFVLELFVGPKGAIGRLLEPICFGLAFIGGAVLIISGLWRIQARKRLYHIVARKQPPAVNDFPLFANQYRIRTHEIADINIGNTQAYPAPVTMQPGTIAVDLYADWGRLIDLYDEYQAAYRQHGVGKEFFAGTVAFRNARTVDGATLDLGHRLVLRASVPPEWGATHQPAGPVARLRTQYRILPERLFYQDGEKFPLECVPQVDQDSSYTLLLQFRYRGRVAVELDECILRIPHELGTVVQVERGRYDLRTRDVMWRNLEFRLDSRKEDRELTLKVTFSEPVQNEVALIHQPELRGHYSCTVDAPLSKMTLQQEHVWNALGRKAVYEQARVRVMQQSTIHGGLCIDLRRLLQEHEYVKVQQLQIPYPLTQRIIALLLKKLVEQNIEIRHIERPLPRPSQFERNHTFIVLWDIFGRYYNAQFLNAVNVHVLVRGEERFAPIDENPSETYIRGYQDLLVGWPRM